MGCRHREKIYTYLHAKNFPDSLFSLLDFYAGKLIQVTIYYKGDKWNREIKKEVMQYFKLKEFSYKASDKNIKTVLRLNKDGYNSLVISDKKALDLIPPWCGNSRKRGSWLKLEKYVLQKK